jgi:hypothetical protein
LKYEFEFDLEREKMNIRRRKPKKREEVKIEKNTKAEGRKTHPTNPPSWQKLRKTHRYTIAMVYFTSDFFYFFLINWFF